MGEQGQPNGAMSVERQLWALEAELRRQGELQDWWRRGVEKDLGRLDKRLKADAEELGELKGSINRAIRWLAIGAAGIIFELLRKGVTF